MTKKRVKPNTAPEAVAPALPAESALAIFSGRRAWLWAFLFLAIGCGRIVSTYNVFATTSDEPAHIACGMEYVANHTYKLETQHPPFTRAMMALLPYLDGVRPRGLSNFQNEGWAILTYQHHAARTLFLARMGNLPFFVLGGLVVFFWTRRYFTPAAGALAVFLYTLVPSILAHAGLATTDMGLAACLGAAFLAALVWVEEPTWRHAVLFGGAAALAALSKFTALGFFPAGIVLALAGWLAIERPGADRLIKLVRERAPSFGLAIAVGLFIWWGAFFFSWGTPPQWHSAIRVPAPEYFDGITAALRHNQTGHPAFLLGETRNTGWWYYFPVAIAVKTPLAFLALLGLGLVLCWRNRSRIAYLLPLAFSMGVLLPSMAGHINIGIRHVLPAYLGFCVLGAAALAQLIEWAPTRFWTKSLAAVLSLWLVATGILHHPDYIPYFNELVSNPENVLLDSDYDWGQDTKRLAARLRELGATSVNYGYTINMDHEFLEAFPGLPPIRGIDPTRPAEGWTAVCPTMLRTEQYGLEYRYPGLRPWFESLQPRERVGTITLYYLPPGSLPGLAR